MSHCNTERRGLRNDGKPKCIAWGPVEEGRGREKKGGKGLYKEKQGLGVLKNSTDHADSGCEADPASCIHSGHQHQRLVCGWKMYFLCGLWVAMARENAYVY